MLNTKREKKKKNQLGNPKQKKKTRKRRENNHNESSVTHIHIRSTMQMLAAYFPNQVMEKSQDR